MRARSRSRLGSLSGRLARVVCGRGATLGGLRSCSRGSRHHSSAQASSCATLSSHGSSFLFDARPPLCFCREPPISIEALPLRASISARSIHTPLGVSVGSAPEGGNITLNLFPWFHSSSEERFNDLGLFPKSPLAGEPWRVLYPA